MDNNGKGKPSGALTHVDESGRARMVDVGGKPVTVRRAVAEGFVTMAPETLKLILENRAAKGNVLETARIAGIQAAKRTSDLIPLCHPLPLSHADVEFFPDEAASRIRILAYAGAEARTGVEMEALAAAAATALTVYDMVKAVDRGMMMGPFRLLEKTGGASGSFRAPEAEA